MRSLLNVLVLLCSISSLHCSDYTAYEESNSNLPWTKVRLFYDKGYGNSYLVNYYETYKDSPMLAVLYVPEKDSESVERMTAFYSQFMNRNQFLDEDEMLSAECNCLFLSSKATPQLQACIGQLKPGANFYLASDDEALVKKNHLNPYDTLLMLFMKGRLIYKESIGPDDPIPYF